MEQGIMDNFSLPQNVEAAGAREAVNKLMFQNIGDNVAIMSGHEKGIPYRFFKTEVFNGRQPKEGDPPGMKYSDSNLEAECVMPLYDDVDAVEFIYSRYRHPVQLVKHLNRERLRVGINGEILGGTMAEDYKRWKEGLGPKGTPLELWSEIGPGVLKTLKSQNIFTVEQFASMPREKVDDMFPLNIRLIFEHLVEYVSGKDAAAVAKDYEEKVAQLEKELAEAKAQNASKPAPVKRGPGRPKKNV